MLESFGRVAVFIVRIGKDRPDDARLLNGDPPLPTTIRVSAKQVPAHLEVGDAAFIVLGSDNSKGAPTEWDQGLRAVGTVSDATIEGWNDESSFDIDVEAVFSEGMRAQSLLNARPELYPRISSMPMVGMSSFSNQTVQEIHEDESDQDLDALVTLIDTLSPGAATEIANVKGLSRFSFSAVSSSSPGGWTEPSFSEIAERIESSGFQIERETLQRYHIALRTRGFVVLSGPSGTGKSWLTRGYAAALEGRFLLVPVSPNWVSNEDLLGFHNPVVDEYVDTDFSRFLREAAAEYEKATAQGEIARPYFAVLDEMNLARVEYYFAKFLSVMESRGQPGAYIELSEEERLPIPANFYAVGTVNVDETTHGFADKVLDRAQVIELTIDEDGLRQHIGKAPHADLLVAVWLAVRDVAPFAYRVADEVERYIHEAETLGIGWEEALDHQVLQKVLPKLARADDRIGDVLLQVQEVCGDTLPLSRAKASVMHSGLEAHGFVSYF